MIFKKKYNLIFVSLSLKLLPGLKEHPLPIINKMRKYDMKMLENGKYINYKARLQFARFKTKKTN